MQSTNICRINIFFILILNFSFKFTVFLLWERLGNLIAISIKKNQNYKQKNWVLFKKWVYKKD